MHYKNKKDHCHAVEKAIIRTTVTCVVSQEQENWSLTFRILDKILNKFRNKNTSMEGKVIRKYPDQFT